MTAGTTLRPADVDELAAIVRDADAARRTVHVVGNETHSGPAGAPPARADVVVSTSALTGVIAHEPGDLTITVRAGTRLRDLEAHLARHAQWLPAPTLGHGEASVGGWLAIGTDSLATRSAGRARDWVIGATAVHGDGRVARGRGRVVKNVAGYDLPRLMVGSLGTLGALADVTFRLAPRAETSTTLQAHGERDDVHAAARALLAMPWAPTFVDVLAQGTVTSCVVGFDGWPARTEPLTRRAADLLATHDLNATLLDDASELRACLDAPDRRLLGAAPARLALQVLGPPATLVARLVDLEHVAREHGADIAWALRGGTSNATAVIASTGRACLDAALSEARRAGAATVIASPERLSADAVWGRPSADFALMQRVKAALDPRGTFLPGRFVGGL